MMSVFSFPRKFRNDIGKACAKWTERMLLAGTMVLVAGHGALPYYFSSHFAQLAGVIAGVVVMDVVGTKGETLA